MTQGGQATETRSGNTERLTGRAGGGVITSAEGGPLLGNALARPGGGSRLYLMAAAVFGLILVGRVLALYNVYFWEEDEISIAAGSAALVANHAGSVYRYTVQLGYYRLIEALDLLAGANLALIPAIMRGLSASAGALIPTLGLFAFRGELSQRERWLAVLMLAANPIIWMSSRYGNTAIAAAALSTLAIVMLSNRPKRLVQVVALALFGIATLVRADSVLLTPLIAFLLYRNERSWARTLTWCVAFGLAMLLVYAVVMLVDPRADSAAGSIARHMSTDDSQNHFWKFLLWAISPIPLMLAAWGLPRLLASRRMLLLALLLWAVPTILFYARATTTPRYFVSVAVPLSLAAAVGLSDLVMRLSRRVPTAAAWALLLPVATAHLFVAMWHFTPDRRPYYGVHFSTHDGPMPTGALLYLTYFENGFLSRSWRHGGFGHAGGEHWEGVAFNKAAGQLADPQAPARTVVVLLAGGWGHAFHYHTQVAGARYLSSMPSVTPWASEAWFELGNARVMTIAEWSDHYRKLERFKVGPGDEFWLLGHGSFPDSLARGKLPPGISFDSLPRFDAHIRVFRVIEEDARP